MRANEASRRRIAIVGAGLTGLTAAWKLHAAGFDVTVFEKTDRVGGRTLSIRKDGFIFDVGAITMLPTYVNTLALIENLGIAGHLHRIVPVIGIPRAGQMHRLDLAHPVRSLLRTKLISVRSKLRLIKLLWPMFRSWRLSNFQTLSTLAEWDDETIATFARREVGEENLEFIADPIIRGNTLNSTDSAPAGELLWMLRQYGAPYLFGFDAGINFLAESLGSRLSVKFGAEILVVEHLLQGVSVRGHRDGSEFVEEFGGVVLALPPPQMLAFSAVLSPVQREFLKSVAPLPSVNLHVGLRRAPAVTETFILPPKSEHAVLTTIVMDHLKAPGRAPAGKGVVSFFLSDDWSRANFERPDAELLADVLAMALPFVGDLSGDVESFVVQRWPYAIIKSGVGLYHQMRAYEAAADANSRIQIGGDFLSMGMEAAICSGASMADRLGLIVGAAACAHAAESEATLGV